MIKPEELSTNDLRLCFNEYRRRYRKVNKEVVSQANKKYYLKQKNKNLSKIG